MNSGRLCDQPKLFEGWAAVQPSLNCGLRVSVHTAAWPRFSTAPLDNYLLISPTSTPSLQLLAAPACARLLSHHRAAAQLIRAAHLNDRSGRQRALLGAGRGQGAAGACNCAYSG